MVVVRRRAWPSRSATVFIGTSRRTIWDAKVCRKTWAPGRGTETPARRSARWAISVTFSAVELPIRGPSRCEDHVRRAGRGPGAQRGDQGLADVGGQWQPSLPSPFAGYTNDPVVPVDVVHREGGDLACPEAKPDQQQQDGAVAKPARTRVVHRGQHPLDVFGGDGAGQRGVRPLADGRHGAVDAGWNHTAGGEEAQKRPGGGDRAPPRRWTEPVGLRLHERGDRRHGEPGPVGRRRPRALGKEGLRHSAGTSAGFRRPSRAHARGDRRSAATTGRSRIGPRPAGGAPPLPVSTGVQPTDGRRLPPPTAGRSGASRTVSATAPGRSD